VVHERALELVETQLDPELTDGARILSAELDALHATAVALAGRLAGTLDELCRREDAVGFEEAHAFLTGKDLTTTYATVRRARELFAAWSGHRALRARAFRLTNVLNAAVGLEEVIIDHRVLDRDLDEEQGQ